MPCAQCAALAAEVEALRALVGERDDVEMEARLRQRLAVGPALARLILRLDGAAGRLAPIWALREAIGLRDLAPSNQLYVYLHRARVALGGYGAIEVVRNSGARLTASGLAAVAAAMARPAQVRRVRRGGRFAANEVRAIRASRAPLAVIADAYGVSPVAIHKIRAGKSYAWV